MATDDVVLLLVCCIVEVVGSGGGDRPMLADLAFMKAFHFCEDSASAVCFALSTLEVRVGEGGGVEGVWGREGGGRGGGGCRVEEGTGSAPSWFRTRLHSIVRPRCFCTFY